MAQMRLAPSPLHHRIAIVATATALALSMAACGSSSSSGTPARDSNVTTLPGATTTVAAGSGGGATPTHLCDVFPKDVAERLTGKTLDVGENSAGDCTYDDHSKLPEHLAVITLAAAHGADQARQFDFNQSHPIGDEVLTPVTGVGDKAFYAADQHALSVLSGQWLLRVATIDYTLNDRAQDLETQVVNSVIAKLS